MDWTCGHNERGEGESGMRWRLGLTCNTALCKIAGCRKLIYSSGSSGGCSVMTYRGGGGMEVQEGGDICMP